MNTNKSYSLDKEKSQSLFSMVGFFCAKFDGWFYDVLIEQIIIKILQGMMNNQKTAVHTPLGWHCLVPILV
ncbi:hypothetical protein ACTXGK_12530 [Psychrobacter sp. T6-5]|uniref:hypothetical protein n=1 Tax=Psychrobacter sp. T6-5 TaxID=3457451 RepID=UPI003FD68ECC